MSFSYEWKLIWYPRLQDQAQGTTGIEIKNFSNVQIVKTVEDNRDSFSFRIKRGNPILDVLSFRSRIEFYKRVNGGSFVPVFTGLVESLPFEFTGTGETITVEGSDASKTVLDAVVFLDAEELRVDEALEQSLDTINNYTRDEFPVTWSSSNPSTDSNGDPFPEVGEKWYYKPMREILRIYSGDSFTGDGRYEYFVTFDQEFVWRKLESTVTGDITPDTFNIVSVSGNRDNDEVTNFVIVKMGNLPTGKSVEGIFIDFGSAGQHGIKLEVESVDSQEVITQHNQAMSELGILGGGKRLPDDTDLDSYNPPWDRTTVIDTQSEYAEELNNFAKTRANKIAESIVDSGKRGRKSFVVRVPANQGVANDNFGLGQVYSFSGFPDVDTTEVRVTKQQVFGGYEEFTLLERQGSI